MQELRRCIIPAQQRSPSPLLTLLISKYSCSNAYMVEQCTLEMCKSSASLNQKYASRVRQGLKIWLGLLGARSHFAGACTGDMPLSTADLSHLPGGVSVHAGFFLGCHTLYASLVHLPP